MDASVNLPFTFLPILIPIADSWFLIRGLLQLLRTSRHHGKLVQRHDEKQGLDGWYVQRHHESIVGTFIVPHPTITLYL